MLRVKVHACDGMRGRRSTSAAECICGEIGEGRPVEKDSQYGAETPAAENAGRARRLRTAAR